jgi:hypothetical protein
MTRPTASEQLSAWIDGELTDAEAAELEAELARDPSLRAELEQLEAVVHLLHTEGPVSAPDGFEARTLARVERERIPGLRLAWVRRPLGVPLEVWGLGLAAAAALVVTVLPTLATRRSELPEPAAIEVRPLPEPKATVEPPGNESTNGDAGIGEASADHRQVARPWASGNVGGAGEAPDAAPPLVDEIAVAPAGPPPPPPDVVLPSYAGTQHWVVMSDDPAAKRDLLALLARHGVTDAHGHEIQSSARIAGTEDLIVVIAGNDLHALQSDLETRLGRLEFTETPLGSEDVLSNGTVKVVISLSWKSEQGTAAP